MNAKKQPPSFNLTDYLLMGISVLIALFGFFGMILTLLWAGSGAFGGESIGLTVLAWGMFIAGAGSGLALFLRKRAKPADWKIVTAVLMWWFGIFSAAVGGFTVLNPGDNSWFENFGYTVAICFAPGGLLALAGVMLFRITQRKSKTAIEPPVAATDAVPTQLQRREKLARAEEYRRHIAELLHNPDVARFVPDVPGLNRKLSEWQTHIGELVERLDAMDKNPLIQRDLQEVPRAIADLKRRLLDETDPDVYTQLEETLHDYRRQQDNLELLLAQKRRIELELDESLATVGTIYSQMQMLGSQKAVDGRRAERLMENVEQETARLNDVLQAMDETYSGSLGL